MTLTPRQPHSPVDPRQRPGREAEIKAAAIAIDSRLMELWLDGADDSTTTFIGPEALQRAVLAHMVKDWLTAEDNQ